MPRDSSGNYTLPSGINPVITGTTIASNWANSTFNDVATSMTDSLSRSGKGGMNAALGLQDGSISSPGLQFAAEPTTGMYRAASGTMAFSTLGAQRLNINGTGNITFNAPSTGNTLTINTLAGGTSGAGGFSISDGTSALTYGADATHNGWFGFSGAYSLNLIAGANGRITLAPTGLTTVSLPNQTLPGNTIGALFAGSAIGIRATVTTTQAMLEGTDYTGAISFQPLILGGSTLTLSTNGAANPRLTITTSGNITANSPSSGATLTVNNTAGGYALQLNGGQNAYAQLIMANTTSGQSFGMQLQGGTTSADTCVTFLNAAGTVNYGRIYGDGSGQLGPGANALQWDTASNLYGRGIAMTKIKTADTARASFTTMTLDPDLQVNILGAGSYWVKIQMVWTQALAGTTPSMYCAISYPGTGVCAQNLYGYTTAQLNGTGGSNTNCNGINLLGGNQGTTNNVVFENVLVASAAGIVGLMWAQAVSSASATTMKVGSMIQVLKIA